MSNSFQLHFYVLIIALVFIYKPFLIGALKCFVCQSIPTSDCVTEGLVSKECGANQICLKSERRVDAKTTIIERSCFSDEGGNGPNNCLPPNNFRRESICLCDTPNCNHGKATELATGAPPGGQDEETSRSSMLQKGWSLGFMSVFWLIFVIP